jgi:type VI secretion system secreted protein VgrG
VGFLEGDPDQPIIVGSVYNADQMPPYTLPANKTQSGIKTRSSTGGGPSNYNEIRFEDKKGSEQLSIHAEKNQDISVESDESHSVGHNRTKTIGNDETTHVKHDRTETVDNNEKITVANGTLEHDVATGTALYHVKGAITENYDDAQTTTVANDIVITSTSGKLYVKAATEIQLEVGQSKLYMDSSGNISLEGINVTMKGAACATVKGGIVHSEADSQHQTKGAIVLSEGSATNTIKGGVVMLNP